MKLHEPPLNLAQLPLDAAPLRTSQSAFHRFGVASLLAGSVATACARGAAPKSPENIHPSPAKETTHMATTKTTYSKVEAQNLELVRSGFEKWQQGSGGVFELLAPEARWTIVGNSDVSRAYASKQEFMESVIQPFNARLSRPLVPNLRGLYADQDMVVALFDGEALAKDGKPYRNTYSWYMRMRAERIVEVVAFFDSVEFNDFWRRVKP